MGNIMLLTLGYLLLSIEDSKTNMAFALCTSHLILQCCVVVLCGCSIFVKTVLSS